MAPDSPSERFADIDAIKAMSALTVVAVHCMRPHWAPGVTRFEVWHGSVFAVLVTPAFLFCGGFLAAAPRLDGATVARRLGRLLGPYLLASLLAELYRSLYLGEPVEPLTDLLMAQAFGPYYFVFHMAWLIPLSWPLSRLPAGPRRAIWALLLVTGGVRDLQLWLTASGLPAGWAYAWLLRNPFVYWGFFLSGWEYRLVHGGARGWLLRRGRMVRWLRWLALGVLLGAALEAWHTPIGHTPKLTYPLIYACLVLALGVRWPSAGRVGRLARWLSERTYSYYLFHLFFVMTAMHLWPQPQGGFSPARFALHYLVGLAGVTALVATRDAVRRAK